MPQGKPPQKPAPTKPVSRLSMVLIPLLAALALASSIALILQHFGGLDLPGCGRGSPCAQAAASRLGSVLGVPTSILGGAFFTAVAGGLIVAPGRSGVLFIWFVRLGAIGSVFLLGGLAALGLACPYCITVHLANFGLWACAERLLIRQPLRWQIPAALAAGMLTLAGLIVANESAKGRAGKATENALTESTRAIVEASKPIQTNATSERRFEGRYRWGPEVAAVRIVLFTDYQCPDCRTIETELRRLMNAGLSVCVSVKQFPLSAECNPRAGVDLHPNACWAARAAEAAGQVGGSEAFWRMHHWLFDRSGSFTNEEFDRGLTELGLSGKGIVQLMSDAEVNRRITADIDEAMSLGIGQTPMIFINGVELKGWNAPKALTRAVQAALAASTSPASSHADRPPDAAERFVADWRESAPMTIAESDLRHTLGPADAEVRVVLFGDYQESGTQEADALLRVFTNGPKPNVRYSFVQFPMNTACNTHTQRSTSPLACTAVATVESAEVLAGPDAFWTMHGWLMSNNATLSEDSILRAADQQGLDVNFLTDAMAQPFIGDLIAKDVELARRVGLRSIPLIIVNGKPVARWKHEAENVLGRIIMEAAGQR